VVSLTDPACLLCSMGIALMRSAVVEIKQQANTFWPMPTTHDTFRSEHLLEGSQVQKALVDTNTEVRGFADRMRAERAEVVPLIAASAVSGGPWSAECYQHLRDYLVALLRDAEPPDGLHMAVHGARVASAPGGEDGCPTGIRHTRARPRKRPRCSARVLPAAACASARSAGLPRRQPSRCVPSPRP